MKTPYSHASIYTKSITSALSHESLAISYIYCKFELYTKVRLGQQIYKPVYESGTFESMNYTSQLLF